MSFPVDRLRLRHLRLLELLEQNPSLRAVAEKMNLSQPAVSQMVKDLENVLGAELIDRSVRGITLNEAGRLALIRSRPSLAFIDKLRSEIEDRAQPVLRIGTNPAVLMHLMPRAVDHLLSSGESIRHVIRSGLVREMVNDLVAGEIDCYIGRVDWLKVDRDAADLLICNPLNVTPLTVACAADHPLTRCQVVRPLDLLAYPWATSGGESSNWAAVGRAFGYHGLRAPRPLIETDLIGMLGFAAGTECLVCVPMSALFDQVRVGLVAELMVEDFHLEPAQVDFVTLVPPSAGSQTEKLLNALRKVSLDTDVPWKPLSR
ncbi:LysR family transcriptional regulator [Seohaeicola zhoushanensis]|uniref:LysR family transcriptional regulator n=1 Tax=Seohaeicola zhoushanensis TaxID=1569283 RepID=A0A8J3H306_9RHOB|nr:LysR family transcriptional regulator [Seohaeicola zhoushanensis]GHF70693.1 LysR family transcriptional regulator [Seohaeicola zhoushanensis]